MSNSILRSSFFEQINLPVRVVLEVIWYWSQKTDRILWYWSCEVKTTSVYYQNGGISKKSIIQVNRFIRNIANWMLLEDEEELPLGGPGHIVQIDENFVSKRKYNRDRMVPEAWVLGMLDTLAKENVIVHLKNRKADTLIPLIKKYVKQGTEIWTDQWRPYSIKQP